MSLVKWVTNRRLAVIPLKASRGSNLFPKLTQCLYQQFIYVLCLVFAFQIKYQSSISDLKYKFWLLHGFNVRSIIRNLHVIFNSHCISPSVIFKCYSQTALLLFKLRHSYFIVWLFVAWGLMYFTRTKLFTTVELNCQFKQSNLNLNLEAGTWLKLSCKTQLHSLLVGINFIKVSARRYFALSSLA